VRKVEIILKLKRKVVKIDDIILLFVFPVFHPIGFFDELNELINPHGIVVNKGIDIIIIDINYIHSINGVVYLIKGTLAIFIGVAKFHNLTSNFLSKF